MEHPSKTPVTLWERLAWSAYLFVIAVVSFYISYHFDRLYEDYGALTTLIPIFLGAAAIKPLEQLVDRMRANQGEASNRNMRD